MNRQGVQQCRIERKELILRAVRQSGELSRMDLAKRLGLSPSSLTALVDDLIQRRYLLEKGAGESSGGRRPTLLTLNPEVGYAVGVDYEPAAIRVGVYDFAFGEVYAVAREADVPQDRSGIIRQLITAVREAIAAADVAKERIVGVGVGVPGIVDVNRGVIFRHTNIEGWQDIPARDLIELDLGVPAVIDNNVRLMALGEKEFGAGRDAESLAFISGRYGIAMGLVINGALHYGTSQMAGEIGHITVDKAGPRCACGKRGCLETLVSRNAVLARVRKSRGEVRDGRGEPRDGGMASGSASIRDIRDVVRALHQHDPAVEAVIEEVADYVGMATAHVITLLNPEVVVFGGDFVEYGDRFLEWVVSAVEETTLADPFRSARFCLSALEKNAGVIGAALRALDGARGLKP